MFVGSFYRVQTREDIDRRVPLGSSVAIVYVEDTNTFYERNGYGMIVEYPIGPRNINTCKCIDHTDEITDMEERIHKLETSFKELKEGGTSYAI